MVMINVITGIVIRWKKNRNELGEDASVINGGVFLD